MKKLNILFLLFITAFFAACDNNCPPQQTIYMSDDFKSYTNFPVGSYWVYQDSLTGSIDSFYLSEEEIKMRAADGQDENCPEYFYESITQSYYRSNIDTITRGIVNDFHIELLCYSFHIFYPNTFIYDFDSDYITVPDTLRKYNHDILTVNQEVYNNVTVMKYGSEQSPRHTSYWVKDIGLIRTEQYKKTENTQTMEDTLVIKKLIRYHINN